MARSPVLRSLRARLTTGLAGIAVALAVLIALGNVAVRRLGGAIGTILTENYVSILACEAMNESLERIAANAAGGLTVDAAERARFEAALAREKANVTEPGEADLAQTIDAEFSPYIADLTAGRREAAASHFLRLKRTVSDVASMNQRAMERSDVHARELARDSLDVANVVSVATLLLAAWLAIALPRAWVAPVEHFREAALRIGDGNFDAPVPTPESTELVPLAAAMSSMLAKLRAYRESSLGELLAAKDLANATIASFDDPVLVIAGGTVLLANNAAETVLGLSEGSDAHRAAPIADLADSVLADAVPSRPTSLADALPVFVAGAERHYLLRGTKLRAEPGEPPRALVVAQDVTRLRKVDEMKSGVVAVVSHELKTPLTSLRMATHLLLEPQNGPLNESQLELVTTARDDTERLRALVDGFLDLTRIEAEAGALRREEADARRLVQEVGAAHRTVAEAAGVGIVIDGPSVVASMDRGKMSIAVSNLVANAIRHTPRGGSIHLGVAEDKVAVLIEVVDTGEGIAPADIAHVFERFHRGKTEGAGEHRLGLGLAITREIIEQHGGTVSATSTPGRGARFTLRIPKGMPRP